MTDEQNKPSVNEPTLSENPRLSEIFDFIQVDEGVRVLPVTVRQRENDTRLFIAIQGEHQSASMIMAQLMTKVDDLYDLAAQNEASNDQPETKIVTS